MYEVEIRFVLGHCLLHALVAGGDVGPGKTPKPNPVQPSTCVATYTARSLEALPADLFGYVASQLLMVIGLRRCYAYAWRLVGFPHYTSPLPY
jgi:hypothetical protein